MAMQDLVNAIDSRLREMEDAERIRKISELLSEFPEDEEFIRENFPQLYEQALQARASKTRVAGYSGSTTSA